MTDPRLNIPNFEDNLKIIVDNIRTTGVITATVVSNGQTTIHSNNTPRAYEVVVINSTSYKVLSAISTEFVIQGEVNVATEWKAEAPYFMDGHLREISNRLAAKDKATGIFKWQKYPLIVLLQNVKYSNHTFENKRAPISIIIVNKTNPDYITEQRRDKNFTPIIDPIYNNLINAINDSNLFKIKDRWDSEREYYWGSQIADSNIFNDHLDAITIDNLNLEITNNCI